MLGLKRVLPGRRWSRLGVVVGGLAALAVGGWCCRGMFIHRAAAQPGAATAEPAFATPSATAAEYTSRVVAYIHGNQAITRQELGEYLIQRYGAEKLPLLLNKRLIDEECKKHGLVVNAAEVDAAFSEDLRGMAIDQPTFIKSVLARAKKNLYEWKEDIIRPRLQMTRLINDRIEIKPEDLQKAFEAAHGEKVECRIILWPHGKEQEAIAQYGSLRASEAAFAQAASRQAKAELAATGGKLKPIGRHMMAPDLEKVAFGLQPGELSTTIKTPDGVVVLRCDRRIPPDATVTLDSVKDKLAADLRTSKMQVEMARLFQALRQEANPRPVITKNPERLPTGPMPPPNEVVAYLRNTQAVTREDLGEFLIARYGSEKVEFLVNRRIIDRGCAGKGISVTEDEIDKALAEDLKLLHLEKKQFEKDLLSKWGKSMYEWREDIIRPRLMLTKLCQGRVKCTDEDVQKAKEAYYGDRMECRMIIWPPDQKEFARKEYLALQGSEAEFNRKAKSQPLPSLASNGGKVPAFGRHTLGDDRLEKEAFSLQPGETSALIETAQGVVMVKCDKRIPADTKVTLEQVRKEKTKEILERKVQQEMQVIFKELRDQAKPQMILKWFGQPEDLVAESRKLLADSPPPPPR